MGEVLLPKQVSTSVSLIVQERGMLNRLKKKQEVTILIAFLFFFFILIFI